MSVVNATTVLWQGHRAYQAGSRNKQHLASFCIGLGCGDHAAKFRNITHNANEDFGTRIVGNNVGRAAAADDADIQRALAQQSSAGNSILRIRPRASRSFSIADSPNSG